MLLVVDANIVVAALIAGKGKTVDLIFSEEINLIAPEFLLEELEEHKSEILVKSSLSEPELETQLALLEKRITFIPLPDFEDKVGEAYELGPDKDDVLYLALGLKHDCGIWTNDKDLKKQGAVKVYTTGELVKKFAKSEDN